MWPVLRRMRDRFWCRIDGHDWPWTADGHCTQCGGKVSEDLKQKRYSR